MATLELIIETLCDPISSKRGLDPRSNGNDGRATEFVKIVPVKCQPLKLLQKTVARLVSMVAVLVNSPAPATLALNPHPQCRSARLVDENNDMLMRLSKQLAVNPQTRRTIRNALGRSILSTENYHATLLRQRSQQNANIIRSSYGDPPLPGRVVPV